MARRKTQTQNRRASNTPRGRRVTSRGGMNVSSDAKNMFPMVEKLAHRDQQQNPIIASMQRFFDGKSPTGLKPVNPGGLPQGQDKSPGPGRKVNPGGPNNGGGGRDPWAGTGVSGPGVGQQRGIEGWQVAPWNEQWMNHPNQRADVPGWGGGMDVNPGGPMQGGGMQGGFPDPGQQPQDAGSRWTGQGQQAQGWNPWGQQPQPQPMQPGPNVQNGGPNVAPHAHGGQPHAHGGGDQPHDHGQGQGQGQGGGGQQQGGGGQGGGGGGQGRGPQPDLSATPGHYPTPNSYLPPGSPPVPGAGTPMTQEPAGLTGAPPGSYPFAGQGYLPPPSNMSWYNPGTGGFAGATPPTTAPVPYATADALAQQYGLQVGLGQAKPQLPNPSGGTQPGWANPAPPGPGMYDPWIESRLINAAYKPQGGDLGGFQQAYLQAAGGDNAYTRLALQQYLAHKAGYQGYGSLTAPTPYGYVAGQGG